MVTSLLEAAPLDERMEFLSPDWFRRAEKRLASHTLRYAAQLGSDAFVLTETYTNTPPHLKFPGNVAALTVSLSNGAFSLSWGAAEQASLRIESDYQKALPISQAVGERARARAMRECAHVYGRNAFKVSGTPINGLAADIMRDFRDHLARRTIENPDIDHRIQRQGLVGKVKEVEELGFTILERAISDELCAELRQACVEEAECHRSGLNKTGRIDVAGLISRGRAFEEIVQVPHLRTLMETAFGPAMILHTVGCSVTRPGPGGVNLHTDYEGIGVTDPYPEFALLGTAVWAFEDWLTEDVGPTWIIPGSHRRRRAPRRTGDSTEGGVPILMPKGSVTFFTHGVWHWQGVRTQASDRVALHNVYTRPFIRQADDFGNLDAILHRNSPVLSALVGHDDHFGRTGHAGHDEARLAVLSRQVAMENKRRRASAAQPDALAS